MKYNNSSVRCLIQKLSQLAWISRGVRMIARVLLTCILFHPKGIKMKRFVLACFAVLLAAGIDSSTASAAQQYGGGAGFGVFPYGFYQPYGAQFSSSVRTPPYFSVVPPVYYGARYSRPYGMSPFASLPLVDSPRVYRGRLRSEFEDGDHVTPEPVPSCNPYVCESPVESSPVAKMQVTKVPAVKGLVQMNPFVVDPTSVAKK